MHEELKQRQSVMWGNGPYERISATLGDLHDVVLDRLDPQPGDRWLDLATGTGMLAERAAERGARVTGVDLAPVLIETARANAAERGLDVEYVVGDCERLELPDGAFDKVSSTVGIMFTPDHQAAARELARVTAPGGRIALANWKPGPGVQDLFKLMSPYQPSPPPSSPFDWGDESRVRELLGDDFELEFEEHVNEARTSSPEEYWELFATSYGPTKSLVEGIGERAGDLRRDWVEFFESHRENGGMLHRRPFILVLGTRR